MSLRYNSNNQSMVMLTTSTDTFASILSENNSEWLEDPLYQYSIDDPKRSVSTNTITDNFFGNFFVPSPSFQSSVQQFSSSSPDSDVSYDSSPFSPPSSSSSDHSPAYQNLASSSNSFLLDMSSITQNNNQEREMLIEQQSHPSRYYQEEEEQILLNNNNNVINNASENVNFFEQLISQINPKDLVFYPDTNINIDELEFDSNPSSKKRKRGEDGVLQSQSPTSNATILPVVNNQRPIFLDRQQLLQFSSKEFDDYKKKLLLNYKLTPEEKDMLKKQRRVIKNREYSQNSRQKKRLRVEELESRISSLEEENQKLKNENNGLKTKLLAIVTSYQQSKLKSQNPPSPTHVSSTTVNSSNGNNDYTSFFSIKNSNKAMVGCAFIILLTFGFLFANNSPSSLTMKKSAPIGRVVFSTPNDNNHVYDFSFLRYFSFMWDNYIWRLFPDSTIYERNNQNDNNSEYVNDNNYYHSKTLKYTPQKLSPTTQESTSEKKQSYYTYDDTHQCDFIPFDYSYYINSPFFMHNYSEIRNVNLN